MNLRIFDLSGRLVRPLIGGEHQSFGRRSSAWDGRDDRGRGAAAGVYSYRLEAGEFASTGRMTLLE